MPSAQWAIGVDVGGTKVVAGLIDADGKVAAHRVARTPHRSTDPSVVEDVIVATVTALVDSAAKDRLASSVDRAALPIGVAAAGWVDSDRATIRFAPHLNWRDEPLAQRLRGRFGVDVTIENDANAAAWGEYRFGAGQGEARLLLITVGTGIGGGMVFDGQVERGAHGMAGEFGHMTVVPDGRECQCGNRGCWEQYVSGPALRRAAIDDTNEDMTGHMLTALASFRDPLAVEAVADVGRWLGRGLANLVAALDPSLIVIGGGVSAARELLLDPARQALASNLGGRGYRPVPPVVVAFLGPSAGMVGAADLARRDARAIWGSDD